MKWIVTIYLPSEKLPPLFRSCHPSECLPSPPLAPCQWDGWFGSAYPTPSHRDYQHDNFNYPAQFHWQNSQLIENLTPFKFTGTFGFLPASSTLPTLHLPLDDIDDLYIQPQSLLYQHHDDRINVGHGGSPPWDVQTLSVGLISLSVLLKDHPVVLIYGIFFL